MNSLLQVLQTDRLKLRSLNSSDLQDIYEYSANNDAVRLLNWGPHETIQESANYLNSVLENYNKANPENIVWGIELLEQKKIIGVIRAFNYSRISARIELSYILNPSFQGKGFMREALKAIIITFFESGKIKRIQAHCSEDNTASYNLLIALNFQKEGLLRCYWNIKNEFKNVIILSLIENSHNDC